MLLGDLNATPDSPEIRMLVDAGLVDVSAVIGPTPSYTHYSAHPHQQIDYILTSEDLEFSDFMIGQSTASDHLPLTAIITLP